MYSQNNEERIILQKFSDINDGKFLDIGAFDVFNLSNTRALFEKGWSGVMVEPSPPRIEVIKSQIHGEDRIQLCEKAISSTAGIVKFFYTSDALSTIEEKHLIKWHNHDFIESEVETITPDMLFEQYGYDFDFISLDVESNNWDVIQHIPFEKLTNLKMICVEHDSFYKDMTKLLESYDFKVVLRNPENIIAVR